MHLNFCPAADWLKRALGIRYAVSLHGVEAWGLTNPARRRGLAYADLKLPISEFTRQRILAEQALSGASFRLLPCTFDADKFTPAPKPEYLLQRYGLTPGQPVIVTVARLAAHEAYKGQDRILRVLSEIRLQLRDVRYVIVGDGNDRPRLERIAEEEGVSDIVTFGGRVPAEELADHYRLCDVFAMPSTGEGFGIVFLEAMACGKPVIGGTRDAAADALRHGELGVLAKRHQHPLIYRPEALRQKVIEYFGFEKFRQTLGDILAEKFPESRSSNR
jgi:glycosyltransferase involved in cell wall biosynthesis